MTNYVKKPVAVEAAQWFAGQPGALPEWAKAIVTEGPSKAFLDTPIGRRHIESGDWIVRDEEGDIISVPNEAFVLFYEAANASDKT